MNGSDVDFLKQLNIPDLLHRFPASDASLAFKLRKVFGEKSTLLTSLIKAHHKAPSKLSTFYRNDLILLEENLAQSSHIFIAQFRAKYLDPQHLFDLTGGLGIDALAFLDHGSRVCHNEITPSLSEIARYNFQKWFPDTKDIAFSTLSAEKCLHQVTSEAWVFIDPSRRINGRRILDWREYQPRLDELIPELEKRKCNIACKVSPMCDISALFSSFPKLSEISVLSLHGEVKELLLLWRKHPDRQKISVHCLGNQHSEQSRLRYFHVDRNATYKAPILTQNSAGMFLYDPDPALIKARLLPKLAYEYGGFLNTANGRIAFFSEQKNLPGRWFHVVEISDAKIRSLKKRAAMIGLGAEIHAANFPEKASTLKKKLALDPHPSRAIWFSKLNESFVSLICTRII